MALVPKFAHDPDRNVVTKTLRIVGQLDDHLVPDNLKPNYRRYMSDQYKQRAQQLGWKAKPGEDDDSRLLRPRIVGVVAEQAEDPGFIEDGKKLALAWLEDHKAVDPDMLDTVLRTAARHGDRPLFDRFRAQAKKETDETPRGSLLSAMGSFSDPAITRVALPIILTDEFDNRESLATSVPWRRPRHETLLTTSSNRTGMRSSPSCPQTSAPFFPMRQEITVTPSTEQTQKHFSRIAPRSTQADLAS